MTLHYYWQGSNFWTLKLLHSKNTELLNKRLFIKDFVVSYKKGTCIHAKGQLAKGALTNYFDHH